MRRAVIACCLALAAGGCGADEQEPAASPDDPVSASAEPAAPATGTPPSPRTCRRLGRRIVGGRLEAAAERAERRRCTLRVAVLDGESQPLTEDYQPARINVRVQDGLVTGVEFMG